MTTNLVTMTETRIRHRMGAVAPERVIRCTHRGRVWKILADDYHHRVLGERRRGRRGWTAQGGAGGGATNVVAVRRIVRDA